MLSDNGSQNIHRVSAPVSGGAYQPDGRDISLLSPAGYFAAAGTVSFGSAFGSSNPNGMWMLFVADLSVAGDKPCCKAGAWTLLPCPSRRTWHRERSGLCLQGLPPCAPSKHWCGISVRDTEKGAGTPPRPGVRRLWTT